MWVARVQVSLVEILLKQDELMFLDEDDEDEEDTEQLMGMQGQS